MLKPNSAYGDRVSKRYAPDTTAQEVGEAASEYFEWTNNPVLTSADSVTTVLNSFDKGRHAVFDELTMYMQEEPSSIDEAPRKWAAIKHWIRSPIWRRVNGFNIRSDVI